MTYYSLTLRPGPGSRSTVVEVAATHDWDKRISANGVMEVQERGFRRIPAKVILPVPCEHRVNVLGLRNLDEIEQHLRALRGRLLDAADITAEEGLRLAALSNHKIEQLVDRVREHEAAVVSTLQRTQEALNSFA